MTLSLRLWGAATTLAAPLLRLHLARRARYGREDPARVAERFGAAAARPAGRLFWLHAASVGETLSALPVLAAMAARDPGLHLLVTTGTRTAATLLAQRLPAGLADRVQHRYAPLDVPRWVACFLDGWRPDAGALVESELWPNLLTAAAARRLPLALLNARLSPRSAARWGRHAPTLARHLLGGFAVVQAQSAGDAARLTALGARHATAPGNLKDAADPLPADPAALAAWRSAVGDRPVWLAASTHPGEETIALAAHAALRATHPGLLLVLAPRHPERGAAIAAMAGGGSRRSTGALPAPDEAVHVADTLGELGLFYRVARVALVGGSLVPHGGQNPLEPARLGCPIVLGPHTANFSDAVSRLRAVGAVLELRSGDAAALAQAVGALLGDPTRAAALATSAAAIAGPATALIEATATRLLGLLQPGGTPDTAPPVLPPVLPPAIERDAAAPPATRG